MSGIDNAKKGMGWRTPIREACWNCAHASEDGAGAFGAVWRCNKGGFITKRLAICDEYRPKRDDTRK